MLADRVRMVSGRKESNIFPPFIYHEGVEGIPLVEVHGNGSYQVTRQADSINVTTDANYTITTNVVYLVTQEPIDYTPYRSIKIVYYPRIAPYGGSPTADVNSEISYDGYDSRDSTRLDVNTVNTVHTKNISIGDVNGFRYLKIRVASNLWGVDVDLMSIELIE